MPQLRKPPSVLYLEFVAHAKASKLKSAPVNFTSRVSLGPLLISHSALGLAVVVLATSHLLCDEEEEEEEKEEEEEEKKEKGGVEGTPMN